MLARLWPSSCAVLIAIPLTIAIVSARPILSTAERSPFAHSQQANTSPAYWTGMKMYVHQRYQRSCSSHLMTLSGGFSASIPTATSSSEKITKTRIGP